MTLQYFFWNLSFLFRICNLFIWNLSLEHSEMGSFRMFQRQISDPVSEFYRFIEPSSICLFQALLHTSTMWNGLYDKWPNQMSNSEFLNVNETKAVNVCKVRCSLSRAYSHKLPIFDTCIQHLVAIGIYTLNWLL